MQNQTMTIIEQANQTGISEAHIDKSVATSMDLLSTNDKFDGQYQQKPLQLSGTRYLAGIGMTVFFCPDLIPSYLIGKLA